MISFSEPFPEWAWAQAWEWAKAYRQHFDDFFPKTIAEFVERYSIRFRNARTFAIWKNGSIGGALAFERDSPCTVVAHILLSKRLRGTPAGELFQAAALVFEDPALLRIHAYVPAWNRLAIALCRRLGGTEEATLRDVTLRHGRPADCVLMSLTRSVYEWLEKEPAYGIKSRRVVRLDQPDSYRHIDDGQHVRAGTNGAAVADRGQPLDGALGGERRDTEPRSGGPEERGGVEHQHDERRDDRPHKPVPRVARVRQKRDGGKSRAHDGVGKAKRARRK